MSLIGLVRAGDFMGAARKLQSIIVDGVIDPVEHWGEQFATDFGKIALRDGLLVAENIFQALQSGQPVDYVAAGQKLVDDIIAQGVQVAEQDALQVGMNAIRTHLNVLQAPNQVAH